MSFHGCRQTRRELDLGDLPRGASRVQLAD